MKNTIKTIVAICAILLASCSEKGEANKDEGKTDKLNQSFLNNIKTIKAGMDNQKEELTLTGKVDYDPDKVINYVSLVNGIADRAYFSLGDKVQKGQTLLDVRSSDLSSLQSDAISAESEVKIARRELQTAQSMYEDNMLSEKELLEAQAKVTQAQAAYSKTQSDIGVHGTNKGNGKFAVKSPMTGFIVSKNVSSGSTVSTDGEPLFTVADLSIVWITANVYASNLQFVKEGMEVDITTLSYPGEIFHGKISSLSQIFDPEERVLKARIVMDNTDLRLKPEMSVVIKLKNKAFDQFIAIPSDALIFDDDKYFVIVKESDEKFQMRRVTLHGHNNKTTYIASGLSSGEDVVISNQLLIYAGLKEN
ncbi:efflux RND transporter periplasmic adaptor subunit [Dysgonomonas macrotermitis]|uniref:Membrane fusion protein, cobalt-zinc-cadmium efflux system n=1 Tax=Dysgonomonas macrotermitis TaxID=1346286 RepID=A0A1M5F5J5_9BACT|nr:efflux RND transporter periplasmic adaptor subunit [Dysgonomonas macrotermitis]SHF86362.1 membrane fusion protein, cobalt-zinc-cadmium efflux system [Dysgonomonas macrotermitis]